MKDFDNVVKELSDPTPSTRVGTVALVYKFRRLKLEFGKSSSIGCKDMFPPSYPSFDDPDKPLAFIEKASQSS